MEKIAIIIDTNIFGDPNNYDFNNIKINTFLNSINGYSNIDVYLPDIVYNEIKKHIREALEQDKRTEKSKYVKDSLKQDFYDKTYDKVIKKLDELIKKYNIKKI